MATGREEKSWEECDVMFGEGLDLPFPLAVFLFAPLKRACASRAVSAVATRIINLPNDSLTAFAPLPA